MKKEYEKPVLEVTVYDIEVIADGSGFEAEIDLGEWWT